MANKYGKHTQIYGMYGCGAFMLNIFEKQNKNDEEKKRRNQLCCKQRIQRFHCVLGPLTGAQTLVLYIVTLLITIYILTH